MAVGFFAAVFLATGGGTFFAAGFFAAAFGATGTFLAAAVFFADDVLAAVRFAAVGLAAAVSRFTSLLKLLTAPAAVSSW